MKNHPAYILVFLVLALVGGISAVKCQQTNAPIKLKSTDPVQAPTPPIPSFQDGVQFGLIAKARNQDVDDVRVLVQLAYRLWHQAWMQQQAIAAQQSAKTNEVPVKTNEPATDHHTQNTNAEDTK